MKKTILALMMLALTGAVSAQDAKKSEAADADAKPKATAKKSAAKSGGGELSRLCNAEASDKKMKGNERSRFIRACMRNEVAVEGSESSSSMGSSGTAGSASSSSSSASGAPDKNSKPTMRNPDPDGRPTGSRGARTDAGGPRPGDTNTKR